jgi:anti-sigma factor RsiW
MNEHDPKNDDFHDHNHETCSQLLSSLGEYVDGTLDTDVCTVIEQHMRGCRRCRVVVDTLRKTIELYHETAEEPGIPVDVKERLYLRLHLEDYKK